MMRESSVLTITLILILVTGCSGTKHSSVPVSPDETLLWSSQSERPVWVMTEPEGVKQGQLIFIGISNRYASEQAAREAARRNVTSSVAKYMGTLVKDKFKKATVSFGLESSVVDATASAIEFEQQITTNIASHVKVKEWYSEKWQTPTGIGYQYFALAKVPVNAVDSEFKKLASDQTLLADQRERQATNALAKAQARQATEFWKQMQNQGLIE